jgi:hypothetical protein
MAFRKIIIRKPAAGEVKILMESYNQELKRFKANPLQAQKFLQIGAYPQADKTDQTACAALMHVISLIYNLDEAISKS